MAGAVAIRPPIHRRDSGLPWAEARFLLGMDWTGPNLDPKQN
jgi:hypothetical protein